MPSPAVGVLDVSTDAQLGLAQMVRSRAWRRWCAAGPGADGRDSSQVTPYAGTISPLSTRLKISSPSSAPHSMSALTIAYMPQSPSYSP